MKDVWGRELKVGDFVLILNQTIYHGFYESSLGAYGNYGILVSSSKIWDGNGNKSYKYLYKVENPIAQEVNEYKKLKESYALRKQEDLQKKVKRMEELKTSTFIPERGDLVFNSVDKYTDWVYLGLIDLRVVLSTGEVLRDEKDIHAYYRVCNVLTEKKYTKKIDLTDCLKQTEQRIREEVKFRDVDITKMNLSNHFKFTKKTSAVLINKKGHVDIGTGQYKLSWKASFTNLSIMYEITLK